MIAFVMIMHDILGHGLPEVPLAERNDAIETFLFDGPDEALGVGIRIRRPPRRLHNSDAPIAQQPPYFCAPFRRLQQEAIHVRALPIELLDPTAS